MCSARQRQWHLFTASLFASMGLFLGACGGGSEEGKAETSSSTLAIDSTANSAPAAAVAQRRKATPHERKGVTAIVMAQDGNSMAAAFSDGSVRVLDATGMREMRVLVQPGGAVVTGLIFSSDGRYLVTVGRDSAVKVWNIATGERRFTLGGHEHPLRAVAASADGSVVATGGEETRVMIWNGTTGRLQRVLEGNSDFVNALSLSADGRLIASGNAAARILVWSVESGKLLQTLRGHADEVNAIAFNADGKLLASAGEDGKVLLWDVVAGRQVHAFDGQRAPMRSLAFNGNGTLLVGGAVDGKVVVWDMLTLKVAHDLGGSTTAVNAVAFDSRNRDQVFAGNEESRVLKWNVPRGAAR